MTVQGKHSTDTVLDPKYPGSDLSIPELCYALKTKLVQADDPRYLTPLPLVKFAEGDLVIAVATLRRIINYHDSVIHRIPPEILATVASHFGDDESLITATHVCHRWRVVLVSSPHLWSHIAFANEERGMAFLERSKFIPVSVDLVGMQNPSEGVRGLMNRIPSRLTALRGEDSQFLDGLLDQPVPILRNLDVIGSGAPVEERRIKRLPSVGSLVTTNLDNLQFHVPHLTNFRFKWTGTARPDRVGMGDKLLNLFRSCPLLETVFVDYGHPREDLAFAAGETPSNVISLPHLRSFTHESPTNVIYIGLFNRLSLPSTCVVAFAIDVTDFDDRPWDPGFPAPRDLSYFSDVKKVSIAFNTRETEGPHNLFTTELTNSRGMRISFNRKSRHRCDPSIYTSDQLLAFLEGIGVMESVETLRFERYPVPCFSQTDQGDMSQAMQKLCRLKTLVLWGCDPDVFFDNLYPRGSWCPTVEELVIGSEYRGYKGVELVKRVRDIAMARQEDGSPLKAITMSSTTTEVVLPGCTEEFEELKGCVESVEAVGLTFSDGSSSVS